jgi:hypothetical protein
VFGVILDAAHVLVGLAVISMTSDATADVARKMVTEIVRRGPPDLDCRDDCGCCHDDLDHLLVRPHRRRHCRHRHHHIGDWVGADRRDVGDLDVLKRGNGGSD